MWDWIVDTLATAIDAVADWAGGVWDNIVDVGGSAIDNIVDWGGDVISGIADQGASVIDNIVDWGGDVISGIADQGASVIDNIADFFTSIPDKVDEVVATVGEKVGAAVATATQSITGWWREQLVALEAWKRTLLNNINETFGWILGFRDIITDFFGDVPGFIQSRVIEPMVDAFNEGFDRGMKE